MANVGGGNIPPLNVTIRISTVGAKNSTAAMRSVTQASGVMARNMNTGAITTRTLGDAMRQAASLMKYTVVGAFLAAGRSAIQLRREFELTFSRIKGLVNVGSDQLEVFRKRVLELAAETGKAPVELADALYFITSSGVKDAKALDILDASAKAAAAGLGETAVVADAVTSVLGAYGNASYDAAYATDIITAAVREGKAEADTFAPAFGKVLPVAAAAGASFEDVAASIAALSRGGLSAGTAAIYIRQVLTQLLKPSKQAAEALARVGLTAEEIRTNIAEKGLFAALTDLRSRLGENTEAVARIFGNVRALTAVLSITGESAGETAEIFERLNNATGDLDYAYQQYTETADQKFARSLAAQQAALISLGKSIMPIVTTLLDLGRTITTAVASILNADGILGGFVRTFLRVGAIATIAVTALTAVFRTTSSLIRLYSNFAVVLQGSIFGVRNLTDTILASTNATNANTAAAAKNNLANLRLNGSKQISATLQRKLNIASAMGVLTQRNALRLAIAEQAKDQSTIAARLRLLALQNALNKAQATGNLQSSVAANLLSLLGTRANLLSTAMLRLGASISVAFKAFGIALAVFSLVSLAMSFFRKDTKETTDEVSSDLSNLNEILDETAKFGKTTITVDAKIKINDEVLTARERIKEQLGDKFFDFLELQQQAGRGAEFARAVIETTFGGVTEATRKALIDAFSQELDIPASDIANAVIPQTTGDLVTDAIVVRAFSKLGEKLSEKGKEELSKVALDPSAGLASITEIVEGLAGGQGLRQASESIRDVFGTFGSAFTEGLQETGQLGPLIEIINTLKTETADLSEIQQNATFAGVLGGALKNLTGDYELVNAEQGNFAKIVNDPKNTVALTKLFRETLGEGPGQATRRVEDLRKRFKALGPQIDSTSATANLFSEYFAVAIEESNLLNRSFGDLESGLKNAEDQFEGTTSAVEDQIDALDKAESSIKKYADGVRGVQGLTLSNTQAQRDFRESLREVSENVKDSGGALLTGSENADKAQASIEDSIEALIKYAGVIAQQDGAEAGVAQIAQGAAFISAQAQRAGASLEDIGKAFAAAGFSEDVTLAFFDAEEAAFDGGKAVGEANTRGIIAGLASAQPQLNAAVGNQAQAIIDLQKKIFGIESPSRVMAAQVGIPLAQGIAAGFSKESSSSRFKNIFGKELVKKINDSIKKAGNTRRGISSFASSFLDRKNDVETPIQDYINAVTGRMREVIGSLGGYLRAQLSFRKAQTDLLKLANTQRRLDAERAQALRNQAFAERRFGLRGGAEITDYEQARIDELQTAFERASRDYALGRTTYVEILDAEIELLDARAAASEVNEDVIDSQNSVIDAQAAINDAVLEFAAAQVGVVESYTKVQEAAIELYLNQDDLRLVFDKVAAAAGVSSGALVIGGEKIADVGIKFGDLIEKVGVDLVSPEGAFGTALQSLGPTMWEAIKAGVAESLDKSPLRIDISKFAVISGGGNGSGNTPFPFDLTPPGSTSTKSPFIVNPGGIGLIRDPRLRFTRAVGGPVTGMTPYLVGEKGPEMFVPRVSGTIVTTSALERYTRATVRDAARAADGSSKPVTVNVYNPVPETASDSITRRMKVLSNAGLFG